MNKFLKNYWAIFIPITILLITALFVWGPCSSREAKGLQIIGMVDAEFVDVSASLPGRLDSIRVAEGTEVKAGDIVAVMKADEVQTIQSQALDAIRFAKSSQELVERGVAPEVLQSAINLQKIAEQQMTLMSKTYKRFKDLYAQGVVSGQEYDLVHFRYEAAQKELETAKLNVELLKNGSNDQMKTKADALLNQARDAEKLTRQIHDKSYLRAPASGVISSVIAHSGEMLNAGYPMMTIRKTNSYFVSFNVRQDKIAGLQKGQLVQVKIPGALQEPISFRISKIAPAMGYADFVPENQKGEFQLRTFKVTAVPVDKSVGEKLHAGMTAELTLPEQ